MRDAVAAIVLLMGLIMAFSPEIVGQWLKAVDEARYSDMIYE